MRLERKPVGLGDQLQEGLRMSELIDELKQRLRIEDVIGREMQIVGTGRERTTVEGADKHDSMKVYPHDNTWRWYSRGIERKQDCLSWLAYRKYGTLAVDGERFIEVLKDACQLAGIVFPEAPDRTGRSNLKRQKEDILEKFVQVAEQARTPEFFVRALQRKAYLTEDVCTRWRLGMSPTLSQCLAAGMDEKSLRLVGLLRDPKSDGPDSKPYMHFRDSIIIPCLEGGRVVFLSSRYLSDVDWQGQKRAVKALHMLSPDQGGNGGMRRPAGFNLSALYDPTAQLEGILLVEGPLDAIACTEREHPAIAMFGSTPSDELIKRLNAA
jgi:DNA primase